MGNESRWRNSWSEVGIAEFPFWELTIFPELPPFWSPFGVRSLNLTCRRLAFLRCCNTECGFIIAGKGLGDEKRPPTLSGQDFLSSFFTTARAEGFPARD